VVNIEQPGIVGGTRRATRARGALTGLLPVALALALAWLVLAPTMADPDLWGHLRYGLDNLDARGVLRTDVYSYLTEPGTWINHEWLAEISLAAAFRAGGSAGVVTLKMLLALASLAAIYAAARTRGAGEVAATVATLFAIASLKPILGPARPQMFTVLGFAVLLLLLVSRERHPNAIWWVVPLFIVWTNAHGGFLAGIGFLGLAVIVEAVQTLQVAGSARVLLQPPFLLLARAGLAALGATLVNPYGLRLWTFLLKTATVPRPEIEDWQPLVTYGSYTLFVAVLALLGIWALYRSRRALNPLLLVTYLVSAILVNSAVRHLLFFGIAWAVFHAEHIDVAGRYLLAPIRLAPRLRRVLLAVAIATTIGAWAGVLTQPLRVEIPRQSYPARAVGLIQRHLPQGRIVVLFDWGQYALWHLGPGVQVSMDGRRETAYSEAIYQENLHLTFGYGEWDVLLERGSPDLVLVSNEHPAVNLMGLHPQWTLVYEDPLCGLYARADTDLAGEISAALPPAIPYDGYRWDFP